MPPRLYRDVVETPSSGRDHAAVATTAGGNQPRSETVWSRSTSLGGFEQITLRARVHHEAKNWLILTDFSNARSTHTMKRNCNTCGGSHLRAGAYTVCGKKLRPNIGRVYFFAHGIERKAQDQLLQ